MKPKPKKGLHRHRILPGHQGGEYTEDNVVYLTHAEHIEAHKKLYEKYGHKEDLWVQAWMAGGKADQTGENGPNWKGGIWMKDPKEYQKRYYQKNREKFKKRALERYYATRLRSASSTV